MEFEIVRGDIVDSNAEAIVLPANEKLKEGSGTSKAIFEAAGRKQLEKACKEIGSCEIGAAVPTPAFELEAKYIIHTVVPQWNDGNHEEYGLLSSAYLTALKLAEIMGCESIAFPLLASGNNGFDRSLAFQIATESIKLFEETSLKKVLVVVFDENTECFVKSLGYTVTEIEKKRKPKVLSEETKVAAEKGLKKAIDWIKDKQHQKQLFELGINIALIVITKNPKRAKAVGVLETLKKLLK